MEGLNSSPVLLRNAAFTLGRSRDEAACSQFLGGIKQDLIEEVSSD